MRKLILLALFLALGCLEFTQSDCPVSQYLDQGVAVTYLDTDFKHLIAGNPLTVIYDMTNLGEATATNLDVSIVGPDNFYLIDKAFKKFDGDSLYPPDPERCLEGNTLSGRFTINSRSGKQTPEKGTPIRLRIGYDYTSRSWADLVVMSYQEWEKSVQADDVPRGNQWESASPVQVKLTVPDSPIVLPTGDPVPIKVRLEYQLSGEVTAVVQKDKFIQDNPGRPFTDVKEICAFPESWRREGEYMPNCAYDLKIELQEGLEFEYTSMKSFCGGLFGPDNCRFQREDGSDCSLGTSGIGACRVVYITPAKVSPDEQRAEDYILWVNVTEKAENVIQENFKIYADISYRMETVYETKAVVIGHAR